MILFSILKVKSFLKRAETDTEAKLLKKLILADIREKYEVVHTSTGATAISYEADADDIYSYYEEYEEGLDDSAESDDSEEEALTDDQLILKYLF